MLPLLLRELTHDDEMVTTGHNLNANKIISITVLLLRMDSDMSI